MIKITAIPVSGEKIFELLVEKEKEIRNSPTTFEKRVANKKGEAKWNHKRKWGWIHFQKCIGGILVASVHPHKPENEWQLVTAFIGYLDRNLKDKIQ